jgi:integrase
MKTPDCYWGPLLALFTGARAEEIASLHLLRVVTEDGIAYIDIKEGKTDAARRTVPIHDQLIALGFLDYVKAMLANGHFMLFPHLQDGKNGYKKNMCRQFGIYLDTPEVQIVDELKVFHSFRHTVITKLTDAGVNEGLKRKMVGHEVDTTVTAHDGYVHKADLTLPSLRREINKLSYDGIDFAGLKVAPNAFLDVVEKKIAQRKARESQSAAVNRK